MARPHHRKKHKEHLRQFQQSRGSFKKDAKGKATNIFAIVGAIVGLAITYFATQGDLVWVIIGLVVGAAAGYIIGINIDRGEKK